jgi:Cu+-exporting ATPase
VVDKTGTLTEGRPALTAIACVDGFEEAEVLRLAASLERMSGHPLAKPWSGRGARGLRLVEPSAFDSPGARGSPGRSRDATCSLGSPGLSGRAGLAHRRARSGSGCAAAEGATAIFVAVDRRLAGLMALADPVKATTPQAVAALKAEGLRVVMLTGDNRRTAEAVARRLGIDEVEAEVLPQDKARWSSGSVRRAAWWPWPATASTTPPPWPPPTWAWPWAPGRTLRSSRPRHPAAGRPSGAGARAAAVAAAMRNIRQNLFFAFVYNAAGVPWRRASSTRLRLAAVAGAGRLRHVAVLGQRHRQRAAAARREALGRRRRATMAMAEWILGGARRCTA